MVTVKGTITAKPDEVDATVIKSWSQVYKGNHDDQIELTSKFLQRYGDFVYVQAEAATVMPFTREMILQDCATASHTSAGWDQWEGADWELLSGEAAERRPIPAERALRKEFLLTELGATAHVRLDTKVPVTRKAFGQ